MLNPEAPDYLTHHNHNCNHKFAFIIHPSDFKHLRTILCHLNVLARFFPESAVKDFLFLMPPKQILSLRFKFDELAQEAFCYGILCPLLPTQMVGAEEKAVLKVLKAIEIAKKLGASLIGLGGFTSIIGNNGLEIAKRSPLPVTSGNTYTAAVIIQSIVKAAKLLELDLKTARIAIIGATGDIGSACARELAKLCNSLILVARNEERLEQLTSSLLKSTDGVEIKVEKRPAKAAAAADVVITVTSAMTTLIESQDLKKGAIVCDASYPANIAREIRNIRDDILVFEGGIVQWPELWQQVPKNDAFWNFNLPIGVHACFAETLLLALEGINTVYSIGRGNITTEKITEMIRVAQKYRFHPAPFWHGRGNYSDQEIERLSRPVAKLP